jgi:hypothetical protein
MARLGRSRPARNYLIIQHVSLQILNSRSIALTAPNLELDAWPPAVTAGATLALTAPNLALAAPLIAPGIGPALTTPNLQLAALMPVPYQVIALTPSPSIPVPIAGFGYQQADIISLWSNAAAFFQQRVVFRATQTVGSTTLPHSAAITTIAYDTILEDPYSGWAETTASQWTAPFAGWHQVTITVWIAAPGATNTVLLAYAQTAKSPGNAANSRALTAVVMPNAVGGAEATWCVYLAAGDAVYGAAAISNSGSDVSTNLTSGENSAIEVVWLAS